MVLIDEHYDLAFKTDLLANPPLYSGEALISLDVAKDTSTIVLNLVDTLKITHIVVSASELKTESAVSVPISSMKYDKEQVCRTVPSWDAKPQERGTISLEGLPGGGLKGGAKAKVFIRFDSELRGTMMGYYKSEGDPDEDSGEKPM